MGAGETPFGPFMLDRGRMALLRDGKVISIGQRGYALLDALLSADEVLSKGALMEAGWPGTIVEEGNLTVQIAALRKALGPREDGQEWIVTVPRVGYRLVRGAAPVPEVEVARLPSVAALPFQNLSDIGAYDPARWQRFGAPARNTDSLWRTLLAAMHRVAR